MSETVWIDFQLWLDNVQVVGYIAKDEDRIQWMSWDGLEVYDDFERTNMVGETAHTDTEAVWLFKWLMIANFLDGYDIIPSLKEYAETGAVITYGNQLDEVKIRLYINCCPMQVGEWEVFNDEIGAYIKGDGF